MIDPTVPPLLSTEHRRHAHAGSQVASHRAATTAPTSWAMPNTSSIAPIGVCHDVGGHDGLAAAAGGHVAGVAAGHHQRPLVHQVARRRSCRSWRRPCRRPGCRRGRRWSRCRRRRTPAARRSRTGSPAGRHVAQQGGDGARAEQVGVLVAAAVAQRERRGVDAGLADERLEQLHALVEGALPVLRRHEHDQGVGLDVHADLVDQLDVLGERQRAVQGDPVGVGVAARGRAARRPGSARSAAAATATPGPAERLDQQRAGERRRVRDLRGAQQRARPPGPARRRDDAGLRRRDREVRRAPRRRRS